LRAPLLRLANALRPHRDGGDHAFSQEQVRRITEETTRGTPHLLAVAALLELNTGLPFALAESDFAGKTPQQRLAVLQARVAELMPDVDADGIRRLVVQYELQVRSQHAYELRPYDGPVLLVEPETPYAGLAALQLRPHVRELRARTVELGPPSRRERQLVERFASLQAHYRSMRDDRFVHGLADNLAPLLD
jgi:hypothetical protein